MLQREHHSQPGVGTGASRVLPGLAAPWGWGSSQLSVLNTPTTSRAEVAQNTTENPRKDPKNHPEKPPLLPPICISPSPAHIPTVGWILPLPPFLLELVLGPAGAVPFAAWVPLAAFAHSKSTLESLTRICSLDFPFCFALISIENGAITGTLSFYCYFFYYFISLIFFYFFLLPRTQFRALNSSLLTSLLSLQILHCNLFSFFLFPLSYKMRNGCEF